MRRGEFIILEFFIGLALTIFLIKDLLPRVFVIRSPLDTIILSRNMEITVFGLKGIDIITNLNSTGTVLPTSKLCWRVSTESCGRITLNANFTDALAIFDDQPIYLSMQGRTIYLCSPAGILCVILTNGTYSKYSSTGTYPWTNLGVAPTTNSSNISLYACKGICTLTSKSAEVAVEGRSVVPTNKSLLIMFQGRELSILHKCFWIREGIVVKRICFGA